MTGQETPAVLTCLSLLFLLSLFIIGQARILPPTCSPSSCGNLRNISYPFRLRGDPSGCGDPDYELDCEDGKTVLININSAKYQVKEISYNSQSIRLVDMGLASNRSCSLPQASLSSRELDRDRRFDPFILISWATFVNCSRPVDHPMYTSIPCRSVNGAHVYVIYEYDNVVSELEESCGLISTVPARTNHVRNSTFDVIERILEMGFDLDWSVGCRDCRSSGGSCEAFSFDIIGCNRGISWSFFKSPSDLAIAVVLIVRYIVAPIIILAFLLYKFRREHLSVKNIKKLLRNQQMTPPDHPSTSEVAETAGRKSDGFQLLPKPTVSSTD